MLAGSFFSFPMNLYLFEKIKRDFIRMITFLSFLNPQFGRDFKALERYLFLSWSNVQPSKLNRRFSLGRQNDLVWADNFFYSK